MHAQDIRRIRYPGSRHQVGPGIEFEPLRIQGRVDCKRCRRKQQRIAIGTGFGDQLRADESARTTAVVHDERLSRLHSEIVGKQPRLDVGAAAGAERHDQANRPLGPLR